MSAVLNFDWNAYIRDVMQTLIFGVQYIHASDVEGEVAEFGTMSGQTAQLLARAIVACDQQLEGHLRQSGTKPKNLHLFDSFVGLPPTDTLADRESPHVRTGVWAPGTCRGLTKDQLFATVVAALPASRVQIYDGWFADTLQTVPLNTKYALLHIDCDLYASTRDVLVNVFGRGLVAEGAIVCFDDWNCNRASPEFGERAAWRECVEQYNLEFSDAGEYGYVSHKFIVHGYDRR